ncbi:MAG: insulinase family protein [Flavobacteriales bacterium]|nr:insulinase family protein [Flavobacteriales bacterium]
MRNSVLSLVLFGSSVIGLHAQKYTYTSVPDDPMEVRIYTLDNGLKVYLSRNTDEPRIQTNIAVRAGSKHDPATSTGLAHYLEHMLFKGTSQIGTANWRQEEALLKAISDRYEARRATQDEQERTRLYREIDSLSTLAAEFAIPNEYDKMISSIGAKGTNAYTSNERTVYINDIPTNELEKWMMVESVRFQELVLRLFHTELETVFEEFNRGQDNDYSKAYKAMNKALYPKHPYGLQTTIGTGEHLKSPSMVHIHNYFDTYYVPNNMAVILAGDLDYDRTIALVDKYFGSWKVKDVPPFTYEQDGPITEVRTVEVLGPMAEWLQLAWRFQGASSDDPIMIDLISSMLSNGQAGIFDLEIVQAQKALSVRSYAGDMADYSMLGIRAQPKQGQSLEQLKDLILEKLELLAEGQFEDWLIEAVVNDARQTQLRYWNEYNNLRAAAMTDAFVLQKDWKDVVSYHDRMAKITKEQVMAFARKHLRRDNHVVLYKRTGEDPEVFRIEKPEITAIDIERGSKSEWYQEWEAVPSASLEPRFVDYEKELFQRELEPGIPFYQVNNPTNELFTLIQILETGERADPMMKLAVKYLDLLGTDKHSASDLKKEFFKLGVGTGVFVSEDRIYLSVQGLDKNLDEGYALFEHLLANAVVDTAKYRELVRDIGKERRDLLKNKSQIMYGGMMNYGMYGPQNPNTDILSMQGMMQLDPQRLVDMIRAINSHEHRIFYYGPRDKEQVMALIKATHRTPDALKPYPEKERFEELPTTGNKVYYVDYDMVQTEVMCLSRNTAYDPSLEAYGNLFNAYFGAGLSSIVFQEIRESKALAYAAYAFFTSPQRPTRSHYLRAYVGTQSDKLGTAVQEMLKLLNDMPVDADMIDNAKQSAMKVIESDRTTKESIYWSYDRLQRMGLDAGHPERVYAALGKADPDGLVRFFKEHIQGGKYTFLVIGKKADMDMDALNKLGPVQELSLKDLFGYAAADLDRTLN